MAKESLTAPRKHWNVPWHVLKLQETVTRIWYNKMPRSCCRIKVFSTCQHSCLQSHKIHSISVHSTFMKHPGPRSELTALARTRESISGTHFMSHLEFNRVSQRESLMKGLRWVQKHPFQPLWENKGICLSEELQRSSGIEPGIFLGRHSNPCIRMSGGKSPSSEWQDLF